MDRKRVSVRLNHVYKVFAIVVSLAVTGCVTTGEGDGWPIETYAGSCNSSMIPFEPSCLSWSDNQGGFKYDGQFVACRQSMYYYTQALDEYYQCSYDELQVIFDNLLKKVPATYNCYVEYYAENKEGDPSVKCPPIEVPRYHASYEVDGLAINLGVPQCIAKHSTHNFAPNRRYQLDDCREQVKVFMGKIFSRSSINAASAKEQYDTYLGNLQRVLDRKANDAVSKFNCIAKGNKYCH